MSTPEAPRSDSDSQDEKNGQPASKEASLDTRFLWVLLGTLVAMVALPLLPETGRNLGGGLLMIWLAYELWILLYRGRKPR